MQRNDQRSDSLAPVALLPLLPIVYDLTEPVTCEWLASGLNDVFRVTAGGRDYVLKVYRAGWRSQAEVVEEIAALLHRLSSFPFASSPEGFPLAGHFAFSIPAFR
jgi:Ser/Thr protein kinase RdoA (MazF antagonist)